MSGNNTLSSVDQGLIAGIPAIFIENYAALSAAVLVLYDFFLTIPLELQYIWKQRMNVMRILFIINRYSSIIYLYCVILEYFVQPATDIECRTFFYMYSIFAAVTTLAINCIFTLRTYAIYGRSKTVFFLVAFPGFASVASQIWEIYAENPLAFPLQLQIGPWHCTGEPYYSFYVAELVNTASSAVFDALIVALTVYRTGRLAMQSREVGISKSLSFVLLRDGTLYYSAIFIPQFVLVILGVVVLRSSNENLTIVAGALDYIFNPLQIVLVNRLVLNLSHTASAREDSEFRTKTGREPPTFATGPYLGNIGAPVRTLPDDPEDVARR